MRRGNKVRYKKHLEFVAIQNGNEQIVSYENPIGVVDYNQRKVIITTPNELTPMNWKHLKWAVDRAKNKTNQNGAQSQWGII